MLQCLVHSISPTNLSYCLVAISYSMIVLYTYRDYEGLGVSGPKFSPTNQPNMWPDLWKGPFLNFQLQLVETHRVFSLYVKLLLRIEPCQECKVTKFPDGTMLTCLKIDSQMHTIGKAIRPVFTDPVTYFLCDSRAVLVRNSQAQKYFQINSKPLH